MKKALLSVLAVVVVLAAIAGVVVAMQPDSYTVQRSATIAAPPAVVFPLINDLQQWSEWTPWNELDPNPKTNISSPSSGKGATFSWNGNEKIGEGTLTILESDPERQVKVDQTFVRPFAGTAYMDFDFEPLAEGTKLSWELSGKKNFVAKAMCMFVDMDTVLGKDFEQGLANIKRVAEDRSATNAAAAKE